VVCTFFPFTRANSDHGVDIEIDGHGSTPPVSQWFKCVRDLQDKPFDKLKSTTCLASILSHSQVLKGKVVLKHYKHADVLTFRLESPVLQVIDVDLDVTADELAQVHQLLTTHGGALKIGESYDLHREHDSWFVLDLLTRSRGKRAVITTTDYLDYRQKTARV